MIGLHASQRLAEMDDALRIEEEIRGNTKGETWHAFRMTDLDDVISFPTGVECETGEFLYGLTRMLKPRKVLETGTRVAVAARYICLALHDTHVEGGEQLGMLHTIERDDYTRQMGIKKLSLCGFSHCFESFCASSMEWEPPAHEPDEGYDLVWLDTEPEYRFKELDRYYDHMNGGAVACVHDLGRLDCTMFSGITPRLRHLVEKGLLRALTFKTQRGISVFQKTFSGDYYPNLLNVAGRP